QKQRVSIARALYYNAEIVLLDDPLSAVDAHVGKYLFTNCFQRALAKKTRLLATHHLHYLPQVDYIICMEDGEIAEQGTYEELMKNEKNCSKLIAEYGKSENDSEIKEDREQTLDDDKENKKDQTDILYNELMSTEELYRGAVNYEIYLAYIRNVGGLLLVLVIIFLFAMMIGTDIGNNLWLSFWSSNKFDISMGVYCSWGVAQGILAVLSSVAFSYGSANASKRLHNKAIKRVLRTPTRFFDTTPLGRIINRLLSESFRMFLTYLSNIIGILILTAVVFAWFIIPMVFLIILYYLTALYYRASSRELKRVHSVLRSSLYAHFSETLTGLPIIRASNMNSVERLVYYNDKLEIEAESIIPDNRPPPGWPS
ncbi:2081_t:CDS:2, partial [Racocetra persica]